MRDPADGQRRIANTHDADLRPWYTTPSGATNTTSAPQYSPGVAMQAPSALLHGRPHAMNASPIGKRKRNGIGTSGPTGDPSVVTSRCAHQIHAIGSGSEIAANIAIAARNGRQSRGRTARIGEILASPITAASCGRPRTAATIAAAANRLSWPETSSNGTTSVQQNAPARSHDPAMYRSETNSRKTTAALTNPAPSGASTPKSAAQGGAYWNGSPTDAAPLT